MQYQWSLGILVAGGYGDGAWLRSVEFFDFKTGTIFLLGHLGTLL